MMLLIGFILGFGTCGFITCLRSDRARFYRDAMRRGDAPR